MCVCTEQHEGTHNTQHKIMDSCTQKKDQQLLHSCMQTCQASVTDLLKKNLGIIGGVGAAIAVIQVNHHILFFIIIQVVWK